MAKLTFEGESLEDLEQILTNLDSTLRLKAIQKAIDAENKYLVQETRTEMRSENLKGGKRENRRALVTAMGKKRKNLRRGAIGYVGARIHDPWRAKHAHLFESGHKVIVSRGPRKGQAPLSGKRVVEGKGSFIKTEARTRNTRQGIVVRTLSEWADKESG